MGISFGGINTGLPPNIVQQLIDAERIPIKTLETRKGAVQEQLKLVDDLTGKMREIFTGIKDLGATKGFADLKLESGDPSIIGGSVDKEVAGTGSYQIEVEKLAHKTSAVSNGFPDKNETQIGVGYVKFDTPEGSREVYIDKTNSTLEKVAASMNRANLGVKASVIEDKSDKDYPYRLMLSGKGIGEDSDVKFPNFYFLDGDQDFFMEKERPAENGKVKIDGQEIEIADNKLKDVIPGVELNLKQAAPGKEISVGITEDREVIQVKSKKFVDGINAVLAFIQKQNAVDENTDTKKTLGGDSMLRNIEGRLRNVLQAPVYGMGAITHLNQIGIQFNRAGVLEFDENKFNATVGKQLPDVTGFLFGDGESAGLVPNLKRTISQILDGVTGPLPQKAQGLRQKISQMDTQIANKERQLGMKEQQLKNQFSHLEETMSKLKSQGAYLAARLGGDGGGGGGGVNLKQS